MDFQMLNSADFYNKTASFYDVMTRFDKRQNREREWIRQWRDKYHFNSALDAGCGTGSTALALAAEGIRTMGIDISEKMIAKAGNNARKLDIENVEFRTVSFENAGNKIKQTFDAIFCLGNSLVHIRPGTALDKTIRSFAKLLNPNGILVIQLLNYAKILYTRERIIDIYRDGDEEFIRFYDFGGEVLNFNILRIDWRTEKASHELQTTRHYPHQRTELEKSLVKYGIEIEKVYGNIKMDDFDPKVSPNLVIAARKK
ncbi:MAG: methyltransferase domain-containing protein [Calditrichaceae bacterium]|nr:methyltransferase domain-containing protein [Calditrichaceae bacterium]